MVRGSSPRRPTNKNAAFGDLFWEPFFYGALVRSRLNLTFSWGIIPNALYARYRGGKWKIRVKVDEILDSSYKQEAAVIVDHLSL